MVSDVGELEVVANPDTTALEGLEASPKYLRTRKKNINYNDKSPNEDDNSREQWSDFESSDTEYIPPSVSPTPTYFDLDNLCSPEDLEVR